MIFQLWGPKVTTVEIAIGGERIPMNASPSGWWTVDVPAAGPATGYTFILDDSQPLPDPRSPWQPHGVHGPSRLIDHQAFAWTDTYWQPGPLSSAILYAHGSLIFSTVVNIGQIIEIKEFFED
jgi:maltooligosyltrehalose trehalohydrolase